MKSTQAMRDRCRELSNSDNDYDRVVICVLDDLEAMLRPCGDLQPGERCDICGKSDEIK